RQHEFRDGRSYRPAAFTTRQRLSLTPGATCPGGKMKTASTRLPLPSLRTTTCNVCGRPDPVVSCCVVSVPSFLSTFTPTTPSARAARETLSRATPESTDGKIIQVLLVVPVTNGTPLIWKCSAQLSASAATDERTMSVNTQAILLNMLS